MKSNRNLLYYYIYSITSAAILTRGIFLIYLQQKGLSIVEVSMYSVVYNICTAVSEVPTGYIGDRIGRKNSIITGTILLACQAGLMVVAQEKVWLILLAGLEAVAYTFISGSDSALLYQMLASRKMEDQYLKINSRILAAQSAVMGGAIFIGAQLAQYSWNLPYLLTMLILIVAAGFMCRVKDLMPFAEREKSTGKLIKTLKDNILYRPLGMFLLFFIGISMIDGIACGYYNLNQLILESVGISVSAIGLFFSLSYIGNSFAYLAVSPLNRIFNRSRIIFLALITECLGFLWLSQVQNKGLFFVISLILCFVPEIIFTVADSIIQEWIVERNRATMLSVMSLIRSLCSGVIYGIFGILLEIVTIEQFLIFLAVGFGVSAASVLIVLRKRR